MARSAKDHSRRPAQAAVEDISVKPMNGQQRDRAVTALAALIAAWQHGQAPGAEQTGADSVVPLPLPGAASNTDHAA